MASVAIVQATTKFTDIAGKTQLVKYNIAKSEAGGVLGVAAMNTAAGAIVDAIEAMSKLKVGSSRFTLPLVITTTGFKADAAATSTVREQGWIVFLSAAGDSLKPTNAKIFIPSPVDTILSSGGTKINKAETATATFITDVKAKLLTADGRALTTDTNTGVRQIT